MTCRGANPSLQEVWRGELLGVGYAIFYTISPIFFDKNIYYLFWIFIFSHQRFKNPPSSQSPKMSRYALPKLLPIFSTTTNLIAKFTKTLSFMKLRFPPKIVTINITKAGLYLSYSTLKYLKFSNFEGIVSKKNN